MPGLEESELHSTPFLAEPNGDTSSVGSLS